MIWPYISYVIIDYEILYYDVIIFVQTQSLKYQFI